MVTLLYTKKQPLTTLLKCGKNHGKPQNESQQAMDCASLLYSLSQFYVLLLDITLIK